MRLQNLLSGPNLHFQLGSVLEKPETKEIILFLTWKFNFNFSNCAINVKLPF